jgi:hypothetical protein
MFELTKIPFLISMKLISPNQQSLTIVMKSLGRPRATANFNWFNIIVNPSRQLRLGGNLQLLQEAHLGY